VGRREVCAAWRGPIVEGRDVGPSYPVTAALSQAWAQREPNLKGGRRQMKEEMQKSLLSMDRLKAACPEGSLTNK